MNARVSIVSLLAGLTACPATHEVARPTTPRAIAVVARICRPLPPTSQPAAAAVVRTASVNIRTDQPAEVLRRLVVEVRGRGGFVAQASQYSDGGNVTLRVPSARFEEALCVLAGLGEVDRQEISSRDVTGDLEAVTARVAHLTRVYRQAEAGPAQGSNQDISFAAWITAQLTAAQREQTQLEEQVAFATIQLALHR